MKYITSILTLFLFFNTTGMEEGNRTLTVHTMGDDGQIVDHGITLWEVNNIPIFKRFFNTEGDYKEHQDMTLDLHETIEEKTFNLILRIIHDHNYRCIDQMTGVEAVTFLHRNLNTIIDPNDIIDLIRTIDFLRIPNEHPTILTHLTRYLNVRGTLLPDDAPEHLPKDLEFSTHEYVAVDTLPGIENNTLNFSNLRLKQIDPVRFAALTKLVARNNKLSSIDGSYLPNSLQHLDLSGNALRELSNIDQLPLLEHLDLSNNQLTTVPNLQQLNALQNLNFAQNNVEIVDSIDIPVHVRNLNISHNGLHTLTGNWLNHRTMETMNFSHNNLTCVNQIHHTKFPSDRASNLPPNLQDLDLSHNQIINMDHPGFAFAPATYPTLKKLNFSHNQIKGWFIDKFLSKNVEQLDVSHNGLTGIDLRELNKLKNLDLSHNDIKHVSDVHKSGVYYQDIPRHLETLNVSNNPNLALHIDFFHYPKKLYAQNIKVDQTKKTLRWAGLSIGLVVLSLIANVKFFDWYHKKYHKNKSSNFCALCAKEKQNEQQAPSKSTSSKLWEIFMTLSRHTDFLI